MPHCLGTEYKRPKKAMHARILNVRRCKCGSDEVHLYSEGGLHWVKCRGCGVKTGPSADPDWVMKIWEKGKGGE